MTRPHKTSKISLSLSKFDSTSKSSLNSNSDILCDSVLKQPPKSVIHHCCPFVVCVLNGLMDWLIICADFAFNAIILETAWQMLIGLLVIFLSTLLLGVSVDAISSNKKSKDVRFDAGLNDDHHHSSTIQGLPCIRRLNQLYCPSPGRNYPA